MHRTGRVHIQPRLYPFPTIIFVLTLVVRDLSLAFALHITLFLCTFLFSPLHLPALPFKCVAFLLLFFFLFSLCISSHFRIQQALAHLSCFYAWQKNPVLISAAFRFFPFDDTSSDGPLPG